MSTTRTGPAMQPATRRDPCPPYVTADDLRLLDETIELLTGTDLDTWWAGPTYRSPDGTRHCALAHLEAAWGPEVMARFEGTWSTSYVLGAVNDGTHPNYQAPTPKERCLAYLSALRAGIEASTSGSMEMQARWCDGLELSAQDMLTHVREHPTTTTTRIRP